MRSTAELVRVDPERVDEFWPHVSPLLKAACYRTKLNAFADIESDILSGRSLLWMAWNGLTVESAAATILVNSEIGKVCIITVCGGSDMKRWLPLIDQIETYASAEGCKRVRIYGRKGWLQWRCLMGLFDGYFDQDQFRDGGGLLGRLLSLQQQQGQYQPGPGFDQAPSVAPAPAPLSMPSPMLLNMQPSVVPPTGVQDLKSQYAALLPILGNHNAMIATVNPEMGKTLIAQALANQQQPGNLGDATPAGYRRPVVSDVSPEPMRPGSQYAQGAMGLCAAGPAGCAVGAGLTVGQAILGGTALGGLGAIILHNEKQDPPQVPPLPDRLIGNNARPGGRRSIRICQESIPLLTNYLIG